MIRGIYTATAGMVQEMERNDVTANNMANANTTGFKKDVAVSKEFAAMLVSRINDGADTAVIGKLGRGAVVDEIATVFSGGTMQHTGNNFNLAIEGEGFFAVETPAGIRYTRNGSFSKNGDGELVTLDGYRVLGQNGPVRIARGGKEVSVTEDGRIEVDGLEVGQLQVVQFEDEKVLAKQGSSLFSVAPGTAEQPATGKVRQGYLEMSNVNVVSEMVNLINGYRAYEINSKSVQSHDQLLDKAINEMGRV